MTPRSGTTSPLTSPTVFLMSMAFINWIGFASWQALFTIAAPSASICSLSRTTPSFAGGTSAASRALRSSSGIVRAR